MYCPRCSQQQVSDEVSFCTRCGFQLGIVKELLVNDGALPAHALEAQANKLMASRKGIRLGIKVIFFSIILLPLFLGLSYIFDSPVPLWAPAIVFLAGLTCVLYSSIFGEDIFPSKQKAQPAFSERTVNTHTLPLPSGTPVGELGATRVNTAEMVQRPSVTEHTTKLLRTTED
jgi:hypothetical protein